ncbi:helix-turn-helix domain-containing protein [uncultured Microbacterium sp.]|uniref:helix-turn-helix domain-containing protein n=1 Tax=uncultured Microbacterium sp. TaxID=191216 RepID=UPI0025E53F00|nr:helix-turn-helix domain-containing protein [uncultured Microbacterium sp.]
MSVEAMAVVLHHSNATGTAKLVLLGIANHEGDGGAWPSMKTLARYANADVRTVQRAIAQLVEAGELRRLVQQGGDHRTPDAERTNLYRVQVVCPPNCDRSARHRMDQVMPTITRVTPASPGDASVTRGVTPVSPKPSMNHPTTSEPEAPHVGNRASGHEHDFDEVSGYCRCGYRDDGRLVDPRSGLQFQPPATERHAS